MSKVPKWLLICMLSLTLGFHWTLLQSVAWVGMMVNYTWQGSLKEGVVKTFDGQHACPLCKWVREGKKSEKKPEAQQGGKKIDLFAGYFLHFEFPPQSEGIISLSMATTGRTDQPPFPPPRAA